jgi:AAHS family 4-hydroxybenzoate transporter-like MFS transporter
MRIDIEQLIDEARLGPLHARVLLLCALAAFLDGFDVATMAAVTPSVAKEWGLVPGALTLIATAAVMGIAVSALLVSPLGDYFGRRVVLLGSFALVGFATLMAATTAAGSPSAIWHALSFSGLLGPQLVSHGGNQLFVWRFLTGLGLGASLPNALALGAEYSPKRSRTALVALLACAISLGSGTATMLAPNLMQLGGWRALFITGGVVALVAWLPLLALPESPRFLVLRGAAPRKIGQLLEKFGTSYRYTSEDRFTLVEPAGTRMPVAQLLAGRLLPATLLLWLVFFLNLGLLYLFSTWLTTLLNQGGLPLPVAQRTAAMFQLGGVAGGFVLALLIKRLGPFVLLAASYTLAALAMVGLSLNIAAFPLVVVAVLIIGNGINGAQVALNALSATLYPTAARASGVGWALGIGRFGAIVGPLMAGTLMYTGAPPGHVFWVAALPTLGCAIAVAVLRMAVVRFTASPVSSSATASP